MCVSAFLGNGVIGVHDTRRTGGPVRSVASLRAQLIAEPATPADQKAPMAWDRDAFENAMIDEMRANGGMVVSGPRRAHLLILHSIGAKSGQERARS